MYAGRKKEVNRSSAQCQVIAKCGIKGEGGGCEQKRSDDSYNYNFDGAKVIDVTRKCAKEKIESTMDAALRAAPFAGSHAAANTARLPPIVSAATSVTVGGGKKK